MDFSGRHNIIAPYRRPYHWTLPINAHNIVQHNFDNSTNPGRPLLNSTEYTQRELATGFYKMNKIQFTNLLSPFDEETLRGLLEQRGYAVSNILLKGSSAVVDLEDPQLVEKAIDSLNGKSIMWKYNTHCGATVHCVGAVK